MFKKHLKLVSAWVFAVTLLAAACTFNWNDNSTSPNPIPTPAPTFAPTPGATAVPKSDVSSVAIFLYGQTCKNGVVPPDNALFTVPMSCIADVTATPKQASGADSQQHGAKISWTPIGESHPVANVYPHPANPEFNRSIVPKTPGTISLQATLVAPDGSVHVGARTLTIVP